MSRVELMFAPLEEADAYRAQGWQVKYLDCHHGRNAVLLWREI